MASSRRSSSSHNPFDSDDDSSPLKYPSVSSSSRASSNPFDDDDPVPPPSRPVRTAASSRAGRFQDSGRGQKSFAPDDHTQRGFDSRNPFDDDGSPAPAVKLGNRRASDPQTLFDDDSKPPADSRSNGHEERSSARKSGRSQIRERAAASGDAAVRKAHKFKDAGANQASKLLEGGLTQAQRLKESSHNAFKSKDGSGELKRGKPKSQDREQLLGGEGDSLFKVSNENATRTRYDDSQFQSADLEYKSVQELEGYAVQKSEETTQRVQNCLKVAEEIREDATKTLVSLHDQGEQIRRTHNVALDIDLNLSTGEKLLGSLGGMFSKTWKPKKGRPVAGPVVTRNDSFKRRGHHLEQRVALGLVRNNSKGRNNRSSSEANGQHHQQTTQAKLDNERSKQDDGLSDLSNVLDQLKEMSVDMGLEISSQDEPLEKILEDVGTLDDRLQGANRRGRHLLKK